ncbi:hypothetical protein NDU88_008439 [Pleurodeles waltl]|uniref:Uncharacterized protein n=1 Tax=Pleurodeles waltl TaxID=8319 RepID=A0AAV7RW39_PLEWA|nr:hypothetical protein NDU88_008439 [Pleurodeles waltl]
MQNPDLRRRARTSRHHPEDIPEGRAETGQQRPQGKEATDTSARAPAGSPAPKILRTIETRGEADPGASRTTNRPAMEKAGTKEQASTLGPLAPEKRRRSSAAAWRGPQQTPTRAQAIEKEETAKRYSPQEHTSS